MSSLSATIRLFLLAFLLCAASAAAQSSITGGVYDELGGAIPNATIVVRDSAGTTLNTTTADSSGLFSLSSLAPGRYEIDVESTLFERTRLMLDVKQDAGVAPIRVT